MMRDLLADKEPFTAVLVFVCTPEEFAEDWVIRLLHAVRIVFRPSRGQSE